jgi:hypothetical protein
MLFPLYDLNPHNRFPFVTLLLIAANCVVMASTWSLSDVKQNKLAMHYGFVPARLSHVGQGQAIDAPVRAFSKRSGNPCRLA